MIPRPLATIRLEVFGSRIDKLTREILTLVSRE
jgi:hypothetical protein